MSSKKWTEEKIERWVKEGRGQGTGADYKPWLTVHDFSSNGRVHRVFSPKFGRRLEFFSDVEYGVFLLAERSSKVVAAHEQWPINRDHSQAIAKKIGARHPVCPGTAGIPYVMTIDLLVTIQDGSRQIKIGIDSKTRDQVENSSVVEKLEITRACLAERGHQHVVVFDTQLPSKLIKNLEYVRSARQQPGEVLPHPHYLNELVDRFQAYICARMFGDKPLRSLCNDFDKQFSLRTGEGLRAARLLIDARVLHTDLNSSLVCELPMKAFSTPGNSNASSWGVL